LFTPTSESVCGDQKALLDATKHCHAFEEPYKDLFKRREIPF